MIKAYYRSSRGRVIIKYYININKFNRSKRALSRRGIRLYKMKKSRPFY